MRTRIEFHEALVSAVGSPYVYFQPPEGMKLNRGNRVIYTRDDFPTENADNKKYIGHTRYTVTLVSKDPDWSLITELPNLLEFCSLDRSFSSDGLNHNVYTVYY